MPNAGHRAIADLEKHVGVTVVTQNIDRLHQEAGSTVVHEVHGSLLEVISHRGRLVRTLSRRQLLEMAEALKRAQPGRFALLHVLRAIRPMAGIGLRGLHFPRIVLFGDAMADPAWPQAREAVRHCDCMIQVGTSGMVMPAAKLPAEAKAAGAKLITVDPHAGGGDVWLQGTAATMLPRLVETAFGQSGEHQRGGGGQGQTASTAEKVTIEGMSPEEILALPQGELRTLILCDKPLVFRIGSAEILGQFRVAGNRLVLELAQIDGGGEGVLPTIWNLADQYARREGLETVEWIVHAVHCARPNLKLRRVVERRGFAVEQLPEIGEVYHLIHHVGLPNEEARPT
jgi:NAD-dependent SIR2 family protein deacetylase